MKKFRLLPHTADVRILAEGTTREELFEAALAGLCRILYPNFRKKEAGIDSERFEVKSIDLTALIIDFLSDALVKMNRDKCLYHNIKFEEIDEKHLKAYLSGSKVKGFKEDVKAVTYHEAEVKVNTRGNLETVIVLDL